VNAGRLLDNYGEFYPASQLFDRLADAGLRMGVGTDSHEPGVISPRFDEIEAEPARRGVGPVSPAELADG
jgi:histidinol-phosphatase (PHP family)